MPFDISRQSKDSKRICFMCHLSPENILMLACDDSICLQCAYTVLKNSNLKQNPYEEIQFRCKCCNQLTYFDRDLIKQIEISIHPQKKTKKDDNFIEKMKKHYLSDDNSRLLKAESNPIQGVSVMNHTVHTTPKQSIGNSQQQFHSIESNNFYPKQRLSTKFQSKSSISNRQQPQTVEQQQQQQQSLQPPQQSVSFQSNTHCKFHNFYQLLYYCIQCQYIVCSQCLLRGKHRNHNNSSITQILSHSLPQFINQTSQLLLSQITHIQSIKETKHSQLNKKLTQIRTIKQNALNYFTHVKQNIEKQQDEVVRRCDGLMNNLLSEQQQIQKQQKEVEQKLAVHIREIKALKSAYKRFKQQQQQQQIKQKNRLNTTLTTAKQYERLLIEKFTNCEQAINNMFNNIVRREESGKNSKIKDKQISNSSNELENESMMLNKHIEKSIKSIRDSLVLPPANPCTRQFIVSNNIVVNPSLQVQPQHQHQRKQQQQLLTKTYHLSKPPKASYISYLSTDNNSPNNKTVNISNYNFIKKQQRSLSISPYKVPETSFYSNNNITNYNPDNAKQTKTNKSKRYSFVKQDNRDVQKENIAWQTRQSTNQRQQKQNLAKITKISSQASSQNVSSKKKPIIQQHQKSNSMLTKSKNNSITKKKHPKIASNNLIGKFQV